MRKTRTLMIFAALGISVAGFFLFLSSARAKGPSFNPYRQLGIFARVLSHLENNYVEPVDQKKLIYGALRGMTETLDPHTAFLTPAQYAQLKGETEGAFTGIGIEIEQREQTLIIITAIEGTPAERAGIRAGDEIIAVDGKSTQGLRLDEAVSAMRGPLGASVELTLRREQQAKPIKVKLVRETIKIVSVSSKLLEPGIGYLRIKTFTEQTDEKVKKEIDQLQHHGKLRGLILDLRNNPGGLLDQAVSVADLFIEQGLLVKTVGKNGQVLAEEKAHKLGTYTQPPIICLVNGGSASAAEIVAGALQDHRRAVVMGTRTFGKGSVQTIIKLEDGSALKMTVARYYTPSGRAIQELGIDPDIVVQERAPIVEKKKGPREQDLKNHLLGDGKTRPEAPRPRLDDFQLQTAMDAIRAVDILQPSRR